MKASTLARVPLTALPFPLAFRRPALKLRCFAARRLQGLPRELPALGRLRHDLAVSGNPPQCLRDWCRVVAVEIREMLPDGASCFDGIVVRNPGIDVMGDVCAPDVMMHKVKKNTVRTVDSHERPLDPRPLVCFEVGDVDISVLEPGVQN